MLERSIDVSATAIICVDIGNSGMRCVRLKSLAPSASMEVPWHGDLLRVDWPRTTVSEGNAIDDVAAQARIESELNSWLQRHSEVVKGGDG